MPSTPTPQSRRVHQRLEALWAAKRGQQRDKIDTAEALKAALDAGGEPWHVVIGPEGFVTNVRYRKERCVVGSIEVHAACRPKGPIDRCVCLIPLSILPTHVMQLLHLRQQGRRPPRARLPVLAPPRGGPGHGPGRDVSGIGASEVKGRGEAEGAGHVC